jgi:uncharacterized protein
MKKMQVQNLTKKIMITRNLGKPDSVVGNMLGLMFKDEEEVAVDGLYLRPCNSIHTFFCKFPLDVYFLNSESRVIRIIKGMKPWRMTRLYFLASAVIEIKSSVNVAIDLEDQLEVTCLS